MRLKGRIRLSYANVVASIARKNYSLQAKDLKRGLLASAAAAPLTSAAFQASGDSGPAGVPPSQSYTGVASLSVAPGSYVVFAKVDMQSDQTDSSRCRLTAEAGLDESNRGLRANGTGEAHNLQLAHTFTQPGAITLSCRTSSGSWSASDTKVLAIKVGSAQAQGVSG